MKKWLPTQTQITSFFAFLSLLILPYPALAENANVSVTVFIAECADGIDNDGDTLIDFPQDPDCDSLGDDSEASAPPGDDDDDDDDDDDGGSGGGSITPRPTPTPPEETPSTEIIFRGRGIPSTQVTLLRDGIIAAVFNADSAGFFEFSMDEIDAGTYTFSLLSRDPRGNTTAPITFTTKIPQGAVVFAEDILFPPTLSLSRNIFNPGEGAALSGYSLPAKTLNLYLNGAVARQIASNSSGFYQGTISLSGLPNGSHNLKSTVIDGSKESSFSKISFIEIGAIPSVEVFTPQITADFNRDGRINLIDLSILVYWYRRSGVPAEVDLNRDGRVDLSDVSILIFYWTG